MIRFSFISTLVTIFCLNLYGQAAMPDDFRTEQIYIAPDKTEYSIGDTIFTSGLVTSFNTFDSSPYSRYLYLELISPGDSVIHRQKISCDDKGMFKAEIPTVYISDGLYVLRGYTQLMRNFSPLSFGYQYVHIGQKKILDNINCFSSTNGGKLKSGTLQMVCTVFQRGDGSPLPHKVINLLANETDTIATATTSASGYATFSFIPKQDVDYTLGYNELRFKLDVVKSNTPKISAVLKGNTVYYNINNSDSLTDTAELYIYDRLNGLSKGPIRNDAGKITLNKTPHVVTMFMINKDRDIINETSVLSTKVLQMPSISMDTIIECEDTVNYDLVWASPAETVKTISRFISANDITCLTGEEALDYASDFAATIPFPCNTALSTPRERFSDIAAWLSCATFKRFSIKEILDSASHINRFLPETTLTIQGTAKDEAKRPKRKGSMLAFNTVNMLPYECTMSDDGTFSIPTDDFENGTEFFLQWLNKDGKPENTIIELATMSYPAVILNKTADKMAYYTDYSIEKPLMSRQLDEIVVKSPPIRQNRFESKKFYGVRAKDHDQIVEKGYLTLLDILRSMPTITVAKYTNFTSEDDDTFSKSLQWVIHAHRGASSLGSGGDRMQLFVDGALFDSDFYDVLFAIPANDIQSVEILSPAESLMYSGSAINGLVAVTTRTLNSNDIKKIPAKGVLASPTGLTITGKQSGKKLQAPSTPGEYVFLVDVLTPTGIHSVAKRVKIVEKNRAA